MPAPKQRLGGHKFKEDSDLETFIKTTAVNRRQGLMSKRNRTACPTISCASQSSVRNMWQTQGQLSYQTQSVLTSFYRCNVHFEIYVVHSGIAVAQWLRCCAKNRKVAGSIPAGVIGHFNDIKSFRSHYNPGVDSASNRNEYQEYFLGVKAAGA